MRNVLRYIIKIFKRDEENSHAQLESGVLLTIGKENTEQALKTLNSADTGLTLDEVNIRKNTYGTNEVSHEKPPAWWMQLAKAFLNQFNIILLILAITSFFIDVELATPGDRNWYKVIILVAIVVISVTLRFFEEFRSQKAAEKLKALVQNKTLVTRQGVHEKSHSLYGLTQDIPVTELVPGDIVHLAAGDMIPADMRIIWSDDLVIDQAALTGESAPIPKSATQNYAKNPLELSTLCFMGSSVVSGTARAVVIHTGNKTYFWSIAKKVMKQKPMTSFEKGINKVSWVLIAFMLVIVPFVFLINDITKHDWRMALLFALAVAVGLTPEMLPLVVTANLAKGSIKMSKHNVIVKKLKSIQNFGAMDVICLDKTGTITENHVVLMRHLDTEGKKSEKVLSLTYLNSYFQTGLRNLVDKAVIEKKEKMFSFKEERKYTKIDEIPFDFDRRRMSVVVQKGAKERLLVCKGSVEEVLQVCTRIEHHGKIRPIEKVSKINAQDLKERMNRNGLRVIAVAYKKLKPKKGHYNYIVKDECDLTLIGFIGFLDPPKASAKEAIKILKGHGITAKIITGDNEVVTARICKDVGLDGGKILLGSEIESLTDEQLADKAEDTIIFAKVDPLQKGRIIKALKSKGHTVGFMGDGINDVSAMREADVSISVDTAVDIAKESADIILLKNDLLVLEHGVIEGRNIFGNIMKYIKMASSSNFGNVLSIVAASIFLPFLPMLPLHLLIQNVLYDISQLSIPWDTMDKEFLKEPRKWRARGIARFMLFIGPISSVFDIITFLVMWFVFKANVPAAQSLFQSGWFVEGLLSQTLIVHMIRTQKIPFIQSRAAKPVLCLTALIMVIGIVIPFTPFGQGVGLQALPLGYFPVLVLILLGYFVVMHLAKIIYIRKFKVWLQ